MRASRVLIGVAAFVLIYGGVAATLFVKQRQILFRPNTTRPDPAVANIPTLQAITLRTASGLDLLAWWVPNPAGPVILYFHGNGGNLADRIDRLRRFAAAGFAILMPEYPGYGGNPGAPSQTSSFETATAALDYLAAHGIPDDRIELYGESLGTGVAAWTASGRPFRALVLESPFTSITALARQQYWFLPVAWLVRDPFDTLSRIASIQSPLLVAIGERDQVVPPAMGREVYQAAPEPKQLWISPDGGHENLAQFGLMSAVEKFLSDPPPRNP